MTKNKTINIIQPKLYQKNPVHIVDLTEKIAATLKKEDDVCNQMLATAAVLICLADRYMLDTREILSIAESLVFSGENGNMRPSFKFLRRYMKKDWEIQE